MKPLHVLPLLLTLAIAQPAAAQLRTGDSVAVIRAGGTYGGVVVTSGAPAR